MSEAYQKEGRRAGLLDEEIELLYEECREKLNETEDDLMDWIEDRVIQTPEFINRLFRAFHCVNGAAGFAGNDQLRNLSHAAESVVGAIRDGSMDRAPETAESLLSAVGSLKQLAAGGEPLIESELNWQIGELNHILRERRPGPASDAVEPRAAGLQPDRGNIGPAEVSGSAGRLKILLVEDDFTSRALLQGLLRAYGDCHIAVNGREAVEAFRAARASSTPYRLICMDVCMPEMDGPEAVRQIRAIEEAAGVLSTSGVAIFMTTAVRALKTVNASYRALCDAYLLKPIDGAQLEQHMRSFKLVPGRGR